MLTSTSTHTLSCHLGERTSLSVIRDAGFEAVDLSMFNLTEDCPIVQGERETREYYSQLKRFAEGIGLSFAQSHAPMPTYSGDEARDESLSRAIVCSIAAAGSVSCPYIVIHPLMLPSQKYLREKNEAWRLNREYFTKILAKLREYDVRVGIENMFCRDDRTGTIAPTCPSYASDMCEYIDGLNEIAGEERFVACLDTGHMLLVRRNPEDEARILGNRLKIIHAHENDCVDDKHALPFDFGTTDWRAFAAVLKEIGYDGAFNIEAEGYFGRYPKEISLDVARAAHGAARLIADWVES